MDILRDKYESLVSLFLFIFEFANLNISQWHLFYELCHYCRIECINLEGIIHLPSIYTRKILFLVPVSK